MLYDLYMLWIDWVVIPTTVLGADVWRKVNGIVDRRP